MHRQEDAERRPAGRRIAFDDAPVIADDLRHQGKSKARALRLGGDEGIEQVGQEVRRDARPVVADRELDRQADAIRRPGYPQAHAGAEGGGQHDLAVERVDADGLGRVLHEVQEHLNEPVAAAENGRQGRVVVLDEPDVTSETRLRRAPDLIEHPVDVDRTVLDGALIAEHLHSLHELHDPVGLVADQLREEAVVGVGPLLQELRGAADAGERVLDLVGQHGAERADRAGGPPIG